MKQLTIKELAPYLPYGLKVNLTRRLFERNNIDLMGLTIVYDINTKEHFIMKSNVTYGMYDIKPILRRLSDLTKEIEHNVEKFVPIEFFEIGDDDNYSFEFDSGNIILIKTLKSISIFNNWHDINFLPYAVTQQLIEWHFDIFGLIENGLAIDINTLK